jgi:hypothetical protein
VERVLLRPEVIKQILLLILNRHFELGLKNLKIDLIYNNMKLVTLNINGSIEYIPKK